MSDTTVPNTEEPPADNDDTTAQGVEIPETDESPEGAEALGDPGKKALDAMKAERNASRQKARELEAELTKLRLTAEDKDKTPDQAAIDAARREALAEANTAANKRILRSEIKAAAAGKLNDPADALTLLDLDQFEVSESGDVDADEIAEAISELVTRKPYLAAQGGAPKFDSGRGKTKTASQLTQADLRGMTSDQINAARKAGRLDSLLGKNK